MTGLRLLSPTCGGVTFFHVTETRTDKPQAMNLPFDFVDLQLNSPVDAVAPVSNSTCVALS